MRLATLCDECEAEHHEACDGTRWDDDVEDWAQCGCRDPFHE